MKDKYKNILEEDRCCSCIVVIRAISFVIKIE